MLSLKLLGANRILQFPLVGGGEEEGAVGPWDQMAP